MIGCNRSLIDLIDRNMFFCKIEKKIKYQIYQNNAKYDHSDVDVERFSVSDNFFVLFFHAAAFLKLLQKILYHQAPFFTIFLK